MSIDIRLLRGAEEARSCATLMSSSEPWVTLGRGFEESLSLVTDPWREVYVAYDEDRFLGFMILNMKGAFAGYIQTVVVALDTRGSGIGTHLVRFAEERIFAETPNVFLCVSSFNPRARALYERLGYEVIGDLKDYLVKGHSETLMRKSIAPLREFRR
jgi:ribosomal-protein-alanine N-acetyltransferase